MFTGQALAATDFLKLSYLEINLRITCTVVSLTLRLPNSELKQSTNPESSPNFICSLLTERKRWRPVILTSQLVPLFKIFQGLAEAKFEDWTELFKCSFRIVVTIKEHTCYHANILSFSSCIENVRLLMSARPVPLAMTWLSFLVLSAASAVWPSWHLV